MQVTLRDVYLSNGVTVILMHLNIDNSSNVKIYHFKACKVTVYVVFMQNSPTSRGSFCLFIFFMTSNNITVVVAKLAQFFRFTSKCEQLCYFRIRMSEYVCLHTYGICLGEA